VVAERSVRGFLFALQVRKSREMADAQETIIGQRPRFIWSARAFFF